MTGSSPAHETRVRVRYGEVDRMGVVYHANYLVYFEQGRTEFLRSLGGSYRRFEDEGFLLVVVETGVRHLRGATYDDLLVVRTRLSELRGVRMRFEYEVLRAGPEEEPAETLATGFTVLACTGRDGRPRRLPEGFRARIEEGLAAAGKNDGRPRVQEKVS